MQQLMQVVKRILTYNDSMNDCVINYTTLCLEMTATMIVINVLNQQYIATLIDKRLYCSIATLNVITLIILVVLLLLFQVVLCIFVGCTGISIVWSSLIGYYGYYISRKWFLYKTDNQHNVLIQQNQESNKSPSIGSCFANTIVALSFLIGVAVWIYYAIFASMITSLAHFCALVLGVLIMHCHFKYFILKTIC